MAVLLLAPSLAGDGCPPPPAPRHDLPAAAMGLARPHGRRRGALLMDTLRPGDRQNGGGVALRMRCTGQGRSVGGCWGGSKSQGTICHCLCFGLYLMSQII